MEEPAFAGCKLTCRVIGLIQAEQHEKAKRASRKAGDSDRASSADMSHRDIHP